MSVNYNEKSEQSLRREKHFSLLGVPCPKSSEDRLNLALDLVSRPRLDYETAIMLFDTTQDRNNSKWLMLMGAVLSHDINAPYFSPLVARTFFETSLSFNDGDASDDSKIDLDIIKASYEVLFKSNLAEVSNEGVNFMTAAIDTCLTLSAR